MLTIVRVGGSLEVLGKNSAVKLMLEKFRKENQTAPPSKVNAVQLKSTQGA